MAAKSIITKPKVSFTSESVAILAAALIKASLRKSSHLDIDDVNYLTDAAQIALADIERYSIFIENFDEIVDALGASQDLANFLLQGHQLSPSAGLAERIRRAIFVWNTNFLNNRIQKARKLMNFVNDYDYVDRDHWDYHSFDISMDEALRRTEKLYNNRLKRRAQILNSVSNKQQK